MNYKECIPMVLHTRCAQMGISESEASVFYTLWPKLNEAKDNLQRSETTLENMYHAFDVDKVMSEDGKPDRLHMYPRLAPSVAAWSGVFNKMLGNQASVLTHAERLALKMVNYMVYTECIYANLVNQLCYVLANANSPTCHKKLDHKTDMVSIARSVDLKYKVEFLKHNLPPMTKSLDITEACNIQLRNMIAHGSLAGNQPPGQHCGQQKPEHRSMSDQIYVRQGFKKEWRWDGTPVNLDDAYKTLCDTTLIWHNVLWCYWDVTFRSQKC